MKVHLRPSKENFMDILNTSRSLNIKSEDTTFTVPSDHHHTAKSAVLSLCVCLVFQCKCLKMFKSR